MVVRIRGLVALLALALLVACVPAGASGGAGARSAADTRNPAPQPSFATPVGGEVTVPDPEGGRPWTLDARRTSSGMICATLRQHGRRPWRVFCTELDASRRFSQAIIRTPNGRTAVAGVVSPGVTDVELFGAHARPVRLARRARAYLVVLPGRIEPEELPMRFTFRDGHAAVLDSGTSLIVQSRDPVSGRRWMMTARRWHVPGGRRLTCASLMPHDRSYVPGVPGLGDMMCGDLDATPFAVQIGAYAGVRFSPEDGARPRRTARTVVYGVAGPQVAAIDVVAGAAPPQRVELSQEGRGFLAIFSPDVHPAAVRVIVTFADGTTQTVDRPFGVHAVPAG